MNFPQELLRPETPYVYFDDIDPDLKNAVQGYFLKDIHEFQDTVSGLSSIDAAFSFLANVIQSERAKEEAFLAYLKGETKNLIDIKVPSLEENWNDFVLDIQQNLDLGKIGIKDLQNEQARLKENIKRYDAAENKDKVWYADSSLSQTANKLKKILDDFQRQKANLAHNSTTKIVLTSIINNFGDKLLTIKDDGKLEFNQTELTALIIAISHEIIKLYSADVYSLEKRSDSKREALTTEKLNHLIEENEITEQIESFITRFKTLPLFRKEIIQNYGFTVQHHNKTINATQFLSTSNNLIKDSSTLVDNLFKVLQQQTIPQSAFKIVTKTNVLAEVESTMNFAMSKALSVKNTGSTGAKPDNIIGYITFDLDSLSDQPQADLIIQRITEIEHRISSLINTLSQKNTAQYYKNQSLNWDKTAREIDDLLHDLSRITNVLEHCYLIEDSTKNYLSLYARNEENGLQSTGVHGGSLGANLGDQLDKIRSLTNAGNITMIDQAWLTAAIINSGPNMIASSQKNKLEQYLSMFAAILLFDGQINIANEAWLYSLGKIPQSNVHQIHLFSVNNGYYPLSYVLKLTYDSLKKNFTEVQNRNLIKDGVTTEIYGYVSQPVGYGLDAWEKTAQIALAQTKIKMQFLVNFMNVLNNLLPDKVLQ